MAEYLIQGETMTNLGDKIRVLNSVEGTMTPVEMADSVQAANDEVDTQGLLIAQIQAALEGKVLSGGAGNVETCTVTVNMVSLQGCHADVELMVIDKNYNSAGLEHYEIYPFTGSVSFSNSGASTAHVTCIPKNSFLYVWPFSQEPDLNLSVTETGNIMYMGSHDLYFGHDTHDVIYEVFFVYGDCDITITGVPKED